MHKKNAKCLGEIQDSDNLQCIPYLQKWQEMNWKGRLGANSYKGLNAYYSILILFGMQRRMTEDLSVICYLWNVTDVNAAF